MSTSHLMEHLRARHKDKLTNEQLVGKKMGKVVVSTGFQTKIDKHVVAPANVEDSIVDFVISTYQPFCVVDTPSFIKMMKANNPNYKPLHRKKLMKCIRDEYFCAKDKLKFLLKGQYYALTTVSYNVRLQYV